MAVQTETMRNLLATEYGTQATHGALYTTVPTTSAGTEVSGGTYARIAMTWSTAATSAITDAPAFNVPASTTVKGFALYDALTAGNYLDGASVTEQAFASAGTYTVTATYTQS